MIAPPDFLAFDPTGLCNYRCTTCVLDGRFPEPTLVEWPVVEALADTLPLLGGLAVGCDAEPTLHPDLPRILRYIRARMPGELMMISNGSRLDPDRAAAIIDTGLDSLSISLDGASAAVFEGIRLRGRFDEVMAHLRWLGQRVEKDGGPTLRLIFTSLASNIDELPEVVEIAARIGIRELSVNGFEPYTVAVRDQRLWRRPGEARDLARVEDAHERARQAASRLGVQLKLPDLELVRDRTCIFATSVVGPAGVVSPCPSLSYDREVPLEVDPVRYRRRVLGRLPEQSFLEIWESEAYVAFRRQASVGLTDPACLSCLVSSGAICSRQ